MDTLILDCDGTLYQNPALFTAVGDRIAQFMVTKLGFASSGVSRIREQYWEDYGTTLAGLIKDTDVNPHEYMDYVHDIHLPDFIVPNPKLKSLLESFANPVYVMSNAPRYHVNGVLEILNIESIPKKIFAIEGFNFEGKPFESSYLKLLEEINLSACNAIMVDDCPGNLVGAKRVGMKTCLVGKPDGYEFDYVIPNIGNLDIIKEI